MSYNDIYDKAYKYALSLKESPLYEELQRLNRKVNEKYKREFKQLKELSVKYNDLLKYKDNSPKFDEVSSEYLLLKTKVFEDDDIIRIKELENHFQDELTDTLVKIRDSISKNIKIDDEYFLGRWFYGNVKSSKKVNDYIFQKRKNEWIPKKIWCNNLYK